MPIDPVVVVKAFRPRIAGHINIDKAVRMSVPFKTCSILWCSVYKPRYWNLDQTSACELRVAVGLLPRLAI
ncbi:hypothetical protein PoMZ_10619 [Pyricularia oryzae]|uniref:Uncharacterized protein n=1 Tax=Pyricularia oryzae TaxID=318829 RepID=A0A4P7MXX7_PYROR|nr:hypothetical protein PoMZ_10619 [Pyricularia oryzae]